MLAMLLLQFVSFLQPLNPSQLQPINPEKPLSVCEVLADLQKYRGKVIQVRDQWNGADVYGRGCAAPKTGDFVWQPAIWLEWSTDQQAVNASEKMKAAIAKKARLVIATFIGRLEAREEGLQTGQGGTPDIVVGNGYGHLAGYPAQLMVATVKDVVPVKQSSVPIPLRPPRPLR